MFYKGLTLSEQDSGWLAFYIHKRLAQQRATAGEYIENELKVSWPYAVQLISVIYSPKYLQSNFPARDVRNFRVIRVRDACVQRRPALRRAQITIWNVLALGEDFLAEGRRYLVRPVFHPFFSSQLISPLTM